MCGHEVHITNTTCRTHGEPWDFRTVVYFCDAYPNPGKVIPSSATCQGRKRADWPFHENVTGKANDNHVYRDCDGCQPIEQAWMDEGLAMIIKDYDTGRLFISCEDHKMEGLMGLAALNIRLADFMETQLKNRNSQGYKAMVQEAAGEKLKRPPKGFKNTDVEDVMEKLHRAADEDSTTQSAVANECVDEMMELIEGEVNAMIDEVMLKMIKNVNGKVVPEAKYV